MMQNLQQLIEQWDAQQAAYITHREERFAVVLDALAHLCDHQEGLETDGQGLTVLDAACGPGSLSQRILERFPRAHVLGLDYDPVLLAIAETWLGQSHGKRFTAIDADLATEGWETALHGVQVHAVVSSTALHWLSPAELVSFYDTISKVLTADGVVLNADHLRYRQDHQPFLSAMAAADDARTQHEAHSQGALTWDQWWSEVQAFPAFAEHRPTRERRFATRFSPTPSPLELHLQALETAGFQETGVLWRYLDDVVVFARR